jgi:hypothetical protein
VALYKIKLKVDYTIDLLVEGATSAEEAMRRALVDADDAMQSAFCDGLNGQSAIGESKAVSAVCVNGLE